MLMISGLITMLSPAIAFVVLWHVGLMSIPLAFVCGMVAVAWPVLIGFKTVKKQRHDAHAL